MNGRDAKLLIAGYEMDSHRLQYSTSELMTHAHIGARDVALFYGRQGEDGETVLRYDQQPRVTVLAGNVTSTWDPNRHDLRLNYTHDGLARVLIEPPGATPLELLIATDDVAAQFWRQDTTAGPVLVRGPELVRTASASGSTLALSGDTTGTTPLEVIAPPAIGAISWNGRSVAVTRTADGTLTGTLAGPRPVTLPALTHWKFQRGAPEAQPGFDDGRWQLADKTSTNNPTPPASPPVLYADDYGFHHGDIWYRGHFRGHGSETGVSLSAITGRAGIYSAWLNGTFLGSSDDTTHRFDFAPGTVRPGQDNVLSVMVENMGHNEDFNADDSHKEPRGLTGATILGSTAQLSWRIQGNLGGEDLVDPVRGPMNSGGLYGERSGWSLPGYPDQSWSTVTLPHRDATPGEQWYRTTVSLDLPRGQDIPIGIKISDDPSHHYRALIFVNGWLIGRYINDTGPENSFPVPTGILRDNGTNTIAIATWNQDDQSGGLGAVSLERYANLASSLTVGDVNSPKYDPNKYRVAPSTAKLSLNAPDVIVRGGSGTVTATFTDPADRPLASAVTVQLHAPDGWNVTPDVPAQLGTVQPGQSVTASWTVHGPTGDQPSAAVLSATATYTQANRPDNADAAATVSVPPPAPTGTVYVSDLPFLSATNGWGPVERDTSNGEQQPGDGHTITLNTVQYSKGLGTNAVSDVALYLGGNCTRFTATVGVDDEEGSAGSVTFSVIADGETISTTPILTGSSASVAIDDDVSGAQRLDLLVGDGGNGNGNDHGDWADAKLVCNQ